MNELQNRLRKMEQNKVSQQVVAAVRQENRRVGRRIVRDRDRRVANIDASGV